MFTNQTPNYGLPQYTSPDELNVLVDFNGAMSDIDTQMKSNELAAQDAKNTAVSASNKADANTLSIQALNDDVNDPATGVGPRVTALEGRVNTIDSLIGNGVPTVGDDTLIGGINANAASIGNLANLTTTDKSSLVAAINEVAQGGGGGGQTVDADDVTYDNTQSGLTATNVQDAIDEVNGKISTSGYECTKLNSATVSLSGTVTVADFSGYDALYFVIHAGTNYYGMTIPVSLFTAGLLWSLTSSNCHVQYVSDTSVTFTLPSGDNAELYGIKY